MWLRHCWRVLYKVQNDVGVVLRLTVKDRPNPEAAAKSAFWEHLVEPGAGLKDRLELHQPEENSYSKIQMSRMCMAYKSRRRPSDHRRQLSIAVCNLLTTVASRCL